MSAKTLILLTSYSQDLEERYIKPFKAAMQGSDVAFADAYSKENYRLNAQAINGYTEASIKEHKPDVVWVISSATALGAIKATKKVPIVVSALSSVDRLQAQKAGNVSAVVNRGWELGAARYKLLKTLWPAQSGKVAVLVKSDNESSLAEWELIENVAGEGAVVRVNVQTQDDLNKQLFDGIVGEGIKSLLVTHVPLFQNCRDRILAEKHRIAIVGHRKYFAEDGALMSLGSNLEGQMRQSARLVQAILENPHDFDPEFEDAKELELCINTATAQKLGIDVPQKLGKHKVQTI